MLSVTPNATTNYTITADQSERLHDVQRIGAGDARSGAAHRSVFGHSAEHHGRRTFDAGVAGGERRHGQHFAGPWFGSIGWERRDVSPTHNHHLHSHGDQQFRIGHG